MRRGGRDRAVVWPNLGARSPTLWNTAFGVALSFDTNCLYLSVDGIMIHDLNVHVEEFFVLVSPTDISVS